MIKTNVAWIEIWHPMSDTVINTVKETCDSEETALKQFQELNKVISSWNTPHCGILLETIAGWIRFPANFISDSILKLHFETVKTYEDE